MQRFRKTLSALLAVVILISVFSFAVSAGIEPLDPSATENIAMKMEVEHADGSLATTVKPGETLTVKVFITAKDAEARLYGGALQVFWDSNVYTYVEGSRSWGLDSIDPTSLYKVSAEQPQFTTTVANMTAEEKAYNWTIVGNFQITNAAGTTNANASLIQAGSVNPFMTIQLKVNDTAQAGLAAPIGIPVTSIAPKARTNYSYIQTWTDANKTVTQNKAKNLYRMDTIVPLTVAGGEQPAAPVLNKDGRQVKMTVQSGAVVKGTEQLRVVSSISKADWDANFAQTATADTTKNAIQKVGIVANNGTVPFDMTTAQNVAKGTPANGYSVAETTYIQQAADNTYKFGARIEYQSDVYDTTYVAFVEYTDAQGVTQYMFYDAEASVAFKTNYTTITGQYIKKFPG